VQSPTLLRSAVFYSAVFYSAVFYSAVFYSVGLLQRSLLQRSLLQRRPSTASVLFIPGLVDFDHRSTLAEALENLAASRCHDFR